MSTVTREMMPPEIRDHHEVLIAALMASLTQASRRSELFEEDTPVARVTRQFFSNTWRAAKEGWLSRTRMIEVIPELSAAPRVFHFTLHRPYKRRRAGQAAVALVPGPICGIIYYREDLFLQDDDEVPTVAVVLHDRALLHPNFSRRHGLLCLGAWGASGGGLAGPIALSSLLEHVYRILSYQNMSLFHPADKEAADYFIDNPTAMEGLRPVPPLY